MYNLKVTKYTLFFVMIMPAQKQGGIYYTELNECQGWIGWENSPPHSKFSYFWEIFGNSN